VCSSCLSAGAFSPAVDAAGLDALIERLSTREPGNWKAIDQSVIKWPKAGEMWEDEIHTLKELTKLGAHAVKAVPAICLAVEQTLWSHSLEAHGSKLTGASAIGRLALVLDGHDEVHVSALLAGLEALYSIGPASPEPIPLLLEVVGEAEPRDGRRMGIDRRSLEPLLLTGQIRSIPDDIPFRSALRGLGLLALAKISCRLKATGLPCPVRPKDLVPALEDPGSAARVGAAIALVVPTSELPPEEQVQVASLVLAALERPEPGLSLRARRVGVKAREQLMRQWQAAPFSAQMKPVFPEHIVPARFY